jgi:hypothetical protein
VSKQITAEEADALRYAPQATLRSYATSETARALVEHLASSYSAPRRRGSALTQKLHAAVGAFVAPLLAAHDSEDDDTRGWVKLSTNKNAFIGQPVAYRSFYDNVRTPWIEHNLIDEQPGFPGKLAFGNPGPAVGRFARFRATEVLIAACAAHGVAPENVALHFDIDFVMPELVQFTSPSLPIPRSETAERLRAQMQKLNDFLRGHTLEPKRHDGFVRKFHLSALDKGGACTRSLRGKPRIIKSQIRMRDWRCSLTANQSWKHARR